MKVSLLGLLGSTANAAELSAQERACGLASTMALRRILANADLIDPNQVEDKSSKFWLLARQDLDRDLTRYVFYMVLHELGSRRHLPLVMVTSRGRGECLYRRVMPIW